MLNVALVGLLAGSIAVGSPDGGDAKKTTGDPPKTTVSEAAAPGIFTRSDDAAGPQTVQDTYAFGISARESPIRFWAHYAQGEVESIYNTAGATEEVRIAGTDGDLVSRRVGIGAELGLPVALLGFGLGVGGQLNLAQNEFQVGEGGGGLITSDINSDFTLQGVKAYAIARTGPLSLHGGYVFDLGQDREFNAPNELGISTPSSLSNSDGRDAIFFGAGFDYPSNRVRVFGGADYYLLQKGGVNNPNTAVDESNVDGDDLMNALIGLGLKFSVFELGAALQIQTRLAAPTVGDVGTTAGIGSSAATIAPYLRISPPRLPASIFIKGAVQDEYTEYGFRLGGSNSVKPSFGFTAGLTVGFN